MNKTLTLLALSAAILLGGCAETRQNFGVVSGSIAYERSTALPDDAELRVELYDLSRGGVGGVLVAEQRTKAQPERGRAEFAMRYNTRVIDPTHTYGLRARLAGQDEPLLETTVPYPVLTQGNPHQVELVLEPTETTVARPDSPAGIEATGSPVARPATESTRPGAPVDLVPALEEQAGN